MRSSSVAQVNPPPKLSICITTRNRASLIGEMLESVVAQETDDCEIVVVDGASTDDTERVVLGYAHRHKRFRYLRQERNGGFDADIDCAIQLAEGEYCWLMPDDDLLKPGAVADILEVLETSYSLVIVNVEIKNLSMTKTLVPKFISIDRDVICEAGDIDALFERCALATSYVGCVVIKKSIWLERRRAQYFGSWLVHIGVIFQARLPEPARVLSKPLIDNRTENDSWAVSTFEIVMITWPTLVWSFPISDRLKRRYGLGLTSRRVGLALLLWGRWHGRYSTAVYRRFLAHHPWSPWQRMMYLSIGALPIFAARRLAYICTFGQPRVLAFLQAAFKHK